MIGESEDLAASLLSDADMNHDSKIDLDGKKKIIRQNPGKNYIDLKTSSSHENNSQFGAKEVNLILSWVLTFIYLDSFHRFLDLICF